MSRKFIVETTADNGQIRRQQAYTATELGLDVSSEATAYEVPSGLVNGSNDTFTFSSTPLLIYRNGVMERRLGTVDGNDFVFDTPPITDDDIEGLI